ncbi:MAG: aldehyde dehydrogenase family protein [Lewinellaceae bacterium]|nr:aldehyde dehydrogenase family protein [Saprospiraceae bacterium]MCB9338005.1 aldehyde dehydrogenase family protein [Lewinellaceae bacterium]
MPATLNIPTTSTQEIHRLFELQREYQFDVARTTAKERIAKLNRLLDAVMRYRPQMKEAMYADFKKPPFEVDGVEVYPVTGAIKHTRRHLRRWMRPEKVPTPLAFAGSTSWIHYEPKGVCLIISPWNFPFNLTFVPLVSAIAAGNCTVLKPSESTPHSSALIKKMVTEIFDEKEVAVVEGAVQESQELLRLPFNHIFFTGSPQVGKLVMAAAAKHLATVTLELGGKSPTIIDETADLATAAQRLARGKFANSGQICIAPDYVFVHEKVKDNFLEEFKQVMQQSYGDDPRASASFARMVNPRQYDRVKGYLEDAISNGAKVAAGGKTDDRELYIEPTVLTNVNLESDIMQEEIFGPLLPVIPFHDLQEPIDFINAGERPLTLSIFSKNKKNIERVISVTRAGGTCINHAQLHFYNHDLPFGGINNSGIGQSHGWYGFKDFSHARSIYRQNFWGPSEALKAPYTKLTERLIDFTIKWL